MKNTVNFYFFGIFSSILYASFYLIYSLKPMFGDDSLALMNVRLVGFRAVILLLLTIIYSLVLKNVNLGKIPVRKVMYFAILFSIILFFLRPLGSTDIFTYIFRGRIISEYSQNPYTVPYINFPDDNFYSQIANQWAPYTAIYGPLFMLFSASLTFLAQESLLLNIFLFKLTSLLSNLANIFLVWRITKSKKALFLYSWNPLINFELVNNAHNDAFMIFLLLLSAYLLVKAKRLREFILVWIFFWLSVLIKFFTLIFAPFLIFYILNRLKSKKERYWFIGVSFIITALLTFLLYFPFWEGMATFGRLLQLTQAQNILSSLGVVLVAVILKLLGAVNLYKIAGIAGKLIFTLFYFGYFVKVFGEKKLKSIKALLLSFSLLFAVFYTFFFNWFFPWYFTSLIAVFVLYLGLSGRFMKVNYLYAITFLGILYYIVLR